MILSSNTTKNVSGFDVYKDSIRMRNLQEYRKNN